MGDYRGSLPAPYGDVMDEYKGAFLLTHPMAWK
jgi:hypothetical protein